MANKNQGSSKTPKPRTNKSQKFRNLYDEGLSIAQIAKQENEYYSFVHRVIRKYQAQLEEVPQNPASTNGKAKKKQIEELIVQDYSVDDILKTLELPEEDRSLVYTTAKKYKKAKKKKVEA